MKDNNKFKFKKWIKLLVFFQVFFYGKAFTQCSVDYVEICDTGSTFSNWTNMDIIGSCLDNSNSNEGAYVVFNVIQSGELNIAVEGLPNSNDFMDVTVYIIPGSTDPCDNPSEISCNFASSASDCASFGGGLGCASNVTGPTVTIGDRVMVLAHDYNNVYNSFSVTVGNDAGKATLGPPLIDLQPTGPFHENDMPALVNTGVDHAGGGVWSASCSGCIEADSGLFDPAAAGSGEHTVSYTHYDASNPCFNTASIDIDVNGVPTITTPSTTTFLENATTAILDVQATDDEDSEPTGLTYAMVASNDSALFSIDADDGELRFITPPDFEDPQDGNADNEYLAEIQVCDAEGGCTLQLITVTVTDEDEDGDGFTADNGELDDTNACIPDNTVSNCCEALAPDVSKD